MFELSVALKYLVPRWRQLSVSIISLISVLVIGLVVWLIVVFFSVTHGLEKTWVQKLVALTAPVRIVPTDAYYKSYYYMVDAISDASNYTPKSIKEKYESFATNPYNPEFDEEIPSFWPEPERHVDGSVKDLVKIAYAAVDSIPGTRASDYEMTVGNLKLGLAPETTETGQSEGVVRQTAYIGSLDPHNESMQYALLPVTADDFHHILKGTDRQNLDALFQCAEVKELKTPQTGWRIPSEFYPEKGTIAGCGLYIGENLHRVMVPANKQLAHTWKEHFEREGIQAHLVSVNFNEGEVQITQNGRPVQTDTEPNLILESEISFPAKKTEDETLNFTASIPVQGLLFSGNTPLRDLEVRQVTIKETFDSIPSFPVPWRFTHGDDSTYSLPSDWIRGEGILLPKAFKEGGVHLGDRGEISYFTPTASAVQEQQIPIFVAGFYDPGIMPLGGKFIITNPEVTGMIRATYNPEDTALSNGINVRFHDPERAEEIKILLAQTLQKEGIAHYWKVESFRDYDFSRDLLQQLRSEKNLFTLISTIIILIACSNIISMLVILVNDKRTEIGILRSMGGSSWSIASIFGFCGVAMGTLGSLIGIFLALVTLRNLQSLVNFISHVQGYEMFNPLFYGEALPNQVSFEALVFVMLTTAAVSLIAGIVPAVKACMVKPSTILRAE